MDVCGQIAEPVRVTAVFIVVPAEYFCVDNGYQYLGVLKKKIADALGAVQSLSLSQRQEAFKLVEECLT